MDEARPYIYKIEDLRLDPAKRLLFGANGDQIPLTPKVFDTLLYLVENAGRMVEKDELMSAIWTDTVVEENNLSQNISILRRVLGEKRGEHRYIVTIPGHGFKFVANVESIPRPDAADGAPAVVDSPPIPENTPLLATAPDAKAENIKPPRGPLLIGTAAITILALSALGIYIWRQSAATAERPIRSVAVLPFKPLVAGNRDEVLEMGMADTLIARLTRNSEVVVRPLSSVRRFAGLEQDAIAAGRSLNVESVLEGNIQRWGDKIRVNVRLIKVADATTLWTGTFDQKFTDIFVVQDAISDQVAHALALQFRIDDKKHYTENVEAYGLYLKGRFQAAKLTREDTEKGISYFEQAIEIDPAYALAYAGLARAYQTLPLTSELPPHEYFPRAKAAANRALEIDPNLVEAHAVLSWIMFWYDWDWSAAEAQCRRALEISPNSADAREAYAHLLSNTGRHEQALEEIKRAREIDPLNLRVNALEGQFLIHAGRADEGLERAQKTIELNPNLWLAHLFAASAYIEKKQYADAVAAARRAKGLTDASTHPATFEAYALARSDRQAEARALLEELLAQSTKRFVSFSNIALVHNALGERDQALDRLEKAFEQHDPKLIFLKIEPRWNNLRDEPRFIALMKRMNFE